VRESEIGIAPQFSVLTSSGDLLAGETIREDGALRRSLGDLDLPWTVVVPPGDRATGAQELAARRRILAVGLAAVVLLLSAGGYLLWRVVQRELALARIQTDFVAAVSHEFRTPLTSLRNAAELLEDDDAIGQERRRTFYRLIRRNTDRLHHLVESLLDFSRMEGRRKPYTFEWINVGTLVTTVATEFQSQLERAGGTFDIAIESDADLKSRVDPAALRHALWNLLDNAMKYSPELVAVRLAVGRHPRGIAVSVSDQGLGIPSHERGAIFRKFVRGHRATELGIHGTGLGLAMVLHVVQAHGGTIELETEEGRGSTFRLVFPAQT